MSKQTVWYKVIVTAPDGRFGQRVIEGGLDKHSAEFEAKRYKERGMVVRVLPANPTIKKGAAIQEMEEKP